MVRSSNFVSVAWCLVHQKHLYTSRKRARGAARQYSVHRDSYRCSEHPRYWHVGRLPEAVRHGYVTRGEFYAHCA
jgi:hypothetical protein